MNGINEYTRGQIDHRMFLCRLAAYNATAMSVSILTLALMPDYAIAEHLSFNDHVIKGSYTSFVSKKGHGKGSRFMNTSR